MKKRSSSSRIQILITFTKESGLKFSNTGDPVRKEKNETEEKKH